MKVNQLLKIKNRKHGLSLIEVIVVFAVLVIVITLSISAVSRFGIADAVKTSAQTLATALNEARARTLASEGASSYGVYVAVGSSSAVLFRGTTYVSSDPNNTVFAFDPRVDIATTTSGTTTAIVFTRLSGTTTPVTVVVGHVKNASTTASISVQGTGLTTVTD